ncbi:MAG: thioredoxin domain-containing protein [Chloroflexi bacterium]|nr:thioredoxin domain-containing protein [Chloroflexota bacterium]
MLHHPGVTLAARLAIGGVFLASAAAKLVYPEAFVRAVQGYEVLPGALVRPLALAFPWLELAVGVFLLVGLYTRLAAGLAAGLMLLFMGLMGLVLVQGKEIDCGCFVGLIQETVGPSTVLRDAVLLALTVPLFLAPRHLLSLDSRLRPTGRRRPGKLVPTALVAVLAVGLGLAIGLAAAAASPADSGAGRPAGGWRLGPETAKVEVVEYSDFQCPACRSVSPLLKRLVDEYAGSVALVYRHFPLPNHPYAVPAAEAAEAAGEQGRFWEMHDAIFANQERLATTDFRQLAERLGLDMKRYDAALASGRPRVAVQADYEEARRIGAAYTPYLLVGGEVVQANSYQALKTAIERKLQSQSR